MLICSMFFSKHLGMCSIGFGSPGLKDPCMHPTANVSQDDHVYYIVQSFIILQTLYESLVAVSGTNLMNSLLTTLSAALSAESIFVELVLTTLKTCSLATVSIYVALCTVSIVM